MQIRIAVADDHPLMLDGVCNLLEAAGMELTGKYRTGRELLEGLPKAALPDVLLLDISFPDTTGNELAQKIRAIYPSVRIIAFTNMETPYQVQNMMQNGCSGYLLKSSPGEVVLEAVKEVFQGRQFLEPSLKDQMLQSLLQPAKNNKLTKRELEILTLICGGKTNAEIAAELFVSPRTVENHRFSLYQKFDVKNTAGLVKVALQQGLIS